MCSPTDLATLNDAQAARTVIEMELATIRARLGYRIPPEIEAALGRAERAAASVKQSQAELYRHMAERHKAAIEKR